MTRIDHARVLDLSREGRTVQSIAVELHCSERAVHNIRRLAGFRSPRLFTPEQLRTIEGMLDDGWSYNEIHRTLGVDAGWLATRFPGRGWTYSQNGTFNAHTRHTRPRLGERKSA